jgi:hypothetical protein
LLLQEQIKDISVHCAPGKKFEQFPPGLVAGHEAPKAEAHKKTSVPTINNARRNNKMDAPVELAPLNEVDAILQHAASHLNKLSLKLPAQYRFRMKDIRVKRAVPAAETATASPPLTLRCKLDVGKCWMAYVPGNFAQAWGYRRALMVSRPRSACTRECFLFSRESVFFF